MSIETALYVEDKESRELYRVLERRATHVILQRNISLTPDQFHRRFQEMQVSAGTDPAKAEPNPLTKEQQ